MAALTADVVGLIRKTILDSYKYSDGFPILKELVQNANDAEASEMSIYFNSGIPNAQHELLRNPALIIYNNGKFTPLNERGIQRIADNNKETDNSKIGKFGLGMKSIFHLCDMFFYAVNTSKAEKTEERVPYHLETINPWETDSDNRHSDWIEFLEDDKNLFEKALPVNMKENQGFLLWIPGKTQDKSPDHITQDFVDLTNPFNKGDIYTIVDKLKVTLALLSKVSPTKDSLKRIYINKEEKSFSIELREKNRISYISESSDRHVEDLIFESYKPNVKVDLKELTEREFWNNNREKEIDCSLIFIKQPLRKGQTGKLHIQYCVYLPLENPEIEMDLDLDADYYVLLHGNFSVDSGRTGIQGYFGLLEDADIESVGDTETAIRYWNKILAQKVLYPNIPAFFYSVANSELLNLNLNETNSILKAISNYPDFGRVSLITGNKYTVSNKGLALCYKSIGTSICKKWSLFDIEKGDSTNYVFIPDEEDYILIDKVFPYIKDGKSNFICKSFSISSILPSRYEPAVETIEILLDEISFSERKEIELLTSFLFINGRLIEKSEKLQSTLLRSIKRSLLQTEINTLYSLRDSYKSFFEQVNNVTGPESLYKLYSVKLNKDRNTTGFEDKDWHIWWGLESKFILLPGFVDLNNSCSEKALIEGSETNDTKDSVCDFVANYITESSKQYFILSGIYADIKQSINKIIAKYPYLHLFEIRNMQLGKNEYADSSLILQLKQDKELFYAIRPNDYEHVLYLYSQLIRSSSFSVYTISDAVIRRTGLDEAGILTAESESIIESFSAHDRFKEYEYNRDVLAKFLEALCSKKPVFKESESFHIRFLISSFDTSLNPYEELYLFDAHCNEVWRRIFYSCKGSVKIISPTFDSYTRDTIIQNGELLRIRLLDDSQCIKALKNACLNNQVDFMYDDYYANPVVLTTILKELDPVKDKEIFYKLPIHINSKTNKRQKFIDGCYLNPNRIAFPPNFENPHVLLSLYNEEKLADLQKRFFSENTLTYIKAIKILLVDDKSKKNNSQWIFEQLRNSKERSLSKYIEPDQLGLSEWIPIKKMPDEFCNLRSILAGNIFSEETEEIISSKIRIYRLEDLDVSSDNKNFLVSKKLLINDLTEEINALVYVINQMQIATIPIDSLDELKQISELLKDNKDFPQFAVVWAFFHDNNIKDKNRILGDFYSRIRGSASNAYELFINMINTSIIGKPNTVVLFNKILGFLIRNYKEKFNIMDIKQYPVMGESIWKSPEKIAASQSSSIISDFRLHKESFEILKDILIDVLNESRSGIEKRTGTEKLLNDKSEPTEIIETFRPWLGQLKNQMLFYIFLFLLKDNFKKAALQQRNENEFDCFTKTISYDRKSESVKLIWNAGYTQEEAIEDKFTNPNKSSGVHFHTIITIPLENKATLQSLAGSLVNVILESKDDVDELFLDKPCYYYVDNKFQIQLAKISNRITDIDEKLKNLIQLILKYAYFQYNESEIQRVLNLILQSNKYSVKAVSIQIMDEIFGLFKQLGLNTEIYIKPFTKKEHELSRDKATGTLNINEYAVRKNKLVEELQELIEGDTSFQEILHNAVMNKINDNQYDETSVLFELLQNADDALKDIKATNPKTSFEVTVADNRILISHYGREINKSPVGKDSSKYVDDLYNMLTINGSNKTKKDNDTGKFGLGFKSVHLICNKPIIRSGELQFEIIGGIYPRTVTDIRLNPGETRIELPLRDGINSEDIISEFKKNAVLQTIFCKCVDRIVIDGFEYKSKRTELASYSTGTVSVIEFADKAYLLFENLQIKRPFSILFKLSVDRKKIIEMKKTDGQKIWNITPLSDGENLPFAINSEFIPDTGRKHLAENKNDVILEQIASEFAQLLSDYLKNDKYNYTDSLLDVLVISSNIREGFFNNFAKNTLQALVDLSNGIIANGFGSVINNKRKLAYIEPTSFGLDSDRCSDFMNMAQNYLNFVTAAKYYLISGVAKKCYREEQLKGIEQISKLSDFLCRYVQGNKLTNEILVLYLRLSEKAEYAIFDFDWSNVYLYSATDKWVTANTMIIDDSNSMDEQHLNYEYTEEVKSFLKQQNVFIRNSYAYEAKQNEKNHSEIEILKAQLAELKSYTNSDFANISDIDGTFYESEIEAPVCDNIQDSVEDIYNWWHGLGEVGQKKEVEKYYSRLLPSEFHYENFTFANKEETSFKTKTELDYEWFILLLLAVYQSIPGNHIDVKNKSFFSRINDLGLVKELSSKIPSENKDAWINMIVDFSKRKEQINGEEYFYWMSRIPNMIRLYEFKESYKEIFKQLDRLNETQIQNILSPETLEIASGTGLPYAPSLKNTLRIGAALIVRELLLKDVLKKTALTESNAFMPKAKIKSYLGLKDEQYAKITSQDIYNRLLVIFNNDKEKATFDGYYDIPLLIKLYDSSSEGDN